MELYDQINSPKLAFLNAFSVNQMPLFGNGAFKHFWIHEHHEGFARFEYAEYLQLKIGCDFNFANFPFDENICDLKFFSPSNTVGNLEFDIPILYDVESKTIVPMNSSLKMKSKRIPFEVEVKSLPESGTLQSLGYEYSVVGVQFKFKRNEIALLMSGFYVPTGLFGAFSITLLVIRTEQVKFLFKIHRRFET